MWIKICGVTGISDAVMIADAGATAIGLNFYPPSKRFVNTELAREIRNAVADRIEVVGVFVNSPADEVARIMNEVGLHRVQFHGDETTELLAEFHRRCPTAPIIRAYRLGDSLAKPDSRNGKDHSNDAINNSLQELAASDISLSAVLIDAFVAGEYGGTGQSVDGRLLQNRPKHWPPLILAGGLIPDTVSSAIETTQPWGVDTASGVEKSPGHKCPRKVQAFIDASRNLKSET